MIISFALNYLVGAKRAISLLLGKGKFQERSNRFSLRNVSIDRERKLNNVLKKPLKEKPKKLQQQQQQQTTNNKQQTTNNKQQTTNNKQQTSFIVRMPGTRLAELIEQRKKHNKDSSSSFESKWGLNGNSLSFASSSGSSGGSSGVLTTTTTAAFSISTMASTTYYQPRLCTDPSHHYLVVAVVGPQIQAHPVSARLPPPAAVRLQAHPHSTRVC